MKIILGTMINTTLMLISLFMMLIGITSTIVRHILQNFESKLLRPTTIQLSTVMKSVARWVK